MILIAWKWMVKLVKHGAINRFARFADLELQLYWLSIVLALIACMLFTDVFDELFFH